MSPTPYPEPLNLALCALAFFRRRHGWSEPHTRRALARLRPTRNLNDAARARALTLSFIRQARAAGFRGSITAAVNAHHKSTAT